MVAEVSIGDLPFGVAGLVAAVFVLPMYGAGALLVRELVVRRGADGRAVLLLGAAYALVEEGLALQSLFSPTAHGGLGPAWGARFLGVNGTYTLVQVVNHAVWSIAVPIALTGIAFPRLRAVPYLSRPGLVVTALVYLLTVGLTASSHSTTDPTYRAPAALLLGTLLVVVALVVVALRPPTARRPPGRALVPPPLRVAVVAGVASSTFLAALVLPGHWFPAVMDGPAVLVAISVAVGTAVVAGRRIASWAGADGWGDRHLLALAGGSIVGHTVIWALTQPRTTTDRVGVMVLLVVTLVLLSLLARRTASPAAARHLR